MATINCKPIGDLCAFDIQRFWKKVDRTPGQGPNGDCWQWNAGKDRKEYGKFQINKKQYTASRVSLFLSTGIDPYPLNACHSCDNPPCCRPDHLYAGSQIDNMREAWGKGRMKCNITPELRRGENNPIAKLTEAGVLDIRRRYWFGNEQQRDLALEYGICQPTVGKIVSGKTWAHVDLMENPERARINKFRRKLSPEDVVDIRYKYQSGTHSQQELAQMFGISQNSISQTVKYVHYKELP